MPPKVALVNGLGAEAERELRRRVPHRIAKASRCRLSEPQEAEIQQL
jgi:hypothetical protein